jgi:GTP-sensing pleiotropic transcriptional regulator CodY
MAKALTIMRKAEGAELGERDMHILDWCGYSLANEEKRACLSIMAKSDHDAFVTTQTIADKIGLDTGVVRNVLQNMASTGVLERSASGTLSWRIKSHEDWKLVRRIEEIKTTEVYAERDLTSEEVSNMNMSDEEVYRSAGF